MIKLIQKSYNKSNYGKLYLIPTPIGNLEDITIRAINILKEVDIVYAEDTRETKLLLNKYDIRKKIESCHKYSEMMHKDRIISILKEGKSIGYVTDRGTPLISDPGNIIVDEVIKNKIDVISLPGPNALLPAINMSGISNERFIFYGFLNSKKNLKRKELIDLKNEKYTLIFYESPFRIKETLEFMLEVFGDRKSAIVREISKIYEEVNRDNISNLIEYCDKIKGEIVLVIEGNKEEVKNINYKKEFNELLKKGYSKRDAIREISDKYSISKNKLYEELKEV